MGKKGGNKDQQLQNTKKQGK
jgi:hypothetical protein